MELGGRVVLITGASRGIGAATARLVHRRGAQIGLIARTADDLDRLTDELGPGTAAAAIDISDPDAVRSAVTELAEKLGPAEVLVNNAGVGAYGAVLEEDPATFERLMSVNYLGTVNVTLAVLAGMVERRGGHIVNVASVAGRVGAPFEAAYSASKFAVVGFSEALAAEVHALGIAVSLVNPGPVATNFTEARGVDFQRSRPRPLSAERIAEAIVAAVEKDRFEQTIPTWLRVAPIVRAVSPGLYRRGLLRDSATEATQLAGRHRPD